MERHVRFPCRRIRLGRMKSVGFDSFRLEPFLCFSVSVTQQTLN